MQRYQALNIMGVSKQSSQQFISPHEEMMSGLVYYSSSVFEKVKKK